MNLDHVQPVRWRGLVDRLMAHQSLVVNAASMLSSTAIGAGLGFVFWVVVAQSTMRSHCTSACVCTTVWLCRWTWHLQEARR